jgi:hypothetical protein
VLSVSSSITPVTGTVTTKDVTAKDGSVNTLSSIKIGGALPVADLGQ